MFDYTKMMFEKTVKDVKTVAYVSNISTQVIYLVYLAYALITGAGFWFVNAVLLGLSLAYFLYFLHSSNHEQKDKRLEKKIRKLYVRIRQAIKLFPLGVALYSLYLTAGNVNVFTLISTAFMLIAWVLQFIFDILGTIIGNRIDLFKEAFDADIDEFKKPVKTVENFFKRVAGQDVDTGNEPSKNRVWLDNQVEIYREEKAEKKQREHEEKAQQRRDEFERTKRKFLQGVKNVLNGNNSNTPPSNDDGEDEND